MINWIYNDGGRAEAGFKGKAGDCGTRAIAIALGLTYKQVYDELNHIRKELLSKVRSETKKKLLSGSVRNGTAAVVMQEYFRRNYWVWVPTVKIGSGCTVHLAEDELPKGRIVCRVSRHYVAVVDGVIWDTHDPSNGGSRCVYGYWRKRTKQEWLDSGGSNGRFVEGC